MCVWEEEKSTEARCAENTEWGSVRDRCAIASLIGLALPSTSTGDAMRACGHGGTRLASENGQTRCCVQQLRLSGGCSGTPSTREARSCSSDDQEESDACSIS